MEKLKSLIQKFSSLKLSGLILAVFLLGIMLILMSDFDGFIKNEGRGNYEKKIEELCREIVKADIYVTVNTNSLGDVAGVALVLKGGDNGTLKLKLTEAISTLFSLPASKIYVTAPIN